MPPELRLGGVRTGEHSEEDTHRSGSKRLRISSLTEWGSPEIPVQHSKDGTGCGDVQFHSHYSQRTGSILRTIKSVADALIKSMMLTATNAK